MKAKKAKSKPKKASTPYAGVLCKKCNHPRGSHEDVLGRPCPCAGGACTCGGFQA